MANISANVTLFEKSVQLLQDTLLANSLYIVLSIPAIVFNTLVIVIICVSKKKLRTKCFVLLAVNAICDLVMGIGYLYIGAIRIHRYRIGSGDVTAMFPCVMKVTTIVYGQLLSLGMAVALSVDRLMATFWAQKYRNWTYRQATVPLILFANAYALSQLAVHYSDAWTGRNIVVKGCGIEESVFPPTLAALTTFQVSTSMIVIFLNCLLAVGIRRHKKKFQVAHTGASQSNQRDNDADSKIARAISVIVITHIFTHLGGRLLIFLAGLYANDYWKAQANRYGRQVVMYNAAIHFFILFSLSTPFQAATKKFFAKFAATSSKLLGSSATTVVSLQRNQRLDAHVATVVL